MRKSVMAGLAGTAALFGGAVFYYLKENQTEEPEYRALQTDGDFQIRSYPAVTVAETIVSGPRRDALGRGFKVLADYLFAKSRPGEALEMTVPVLQDAGDPMGQEPPTFDDELIDGGWRTRFVMPGGRAAGDYPEPPEAIELVTLPARKVGVVRFSGRPSERDLAEQEDRLRGWLARHGESSEGEPEYAFYNSPPIPGPLRRNEIWLELR